MLLFFSGLVLLLRMCILGHAFQRHYDIRRDFSERRDSLLFAAARSERVSNFYNAAAKIVVNINRERTLAFVDSLISHPGGDMFFTYPLIGFFLHTRDILPENLTQRIKKTFVSYTAYRGDTENHWMMYYTALYLASQTWKAVPGDIWYTGKTSKENFREAEGWLNHWIKLTTTLGQGEFDSPRYGSCFLGPAFLLYDFAEDQDMRKKAGMILDLLLADYGIDYLNGLYTGGHSRIIGNQVHDDLSTPMHSFGYLYFGQTDFPRRKNMVIFACLSSYRLPPVIYKIATDRKKPYVSRETKRVRNIIRFGTEKNPPVFKCNYMTERYCLGSLQGGILQPIQQHTWDVSYPGGTIFSLHPYFSYKELGMFFPEEIKILIEDVQKSKTTYTNEDKWVASSPFEQTFQYKNTIIVLYTIEEGEWPCHIDAFFPKNLVKIEREKNGWIFYEAGEIFIAYYPVKSYEWLEEEINYRLRSYNQQNGLILEVDEKNNYSSFQDFQQRMKRNTVFIDSSGTALSVSYTASDGTKLEFTYGGSRKLNGRIMDFKDNGLYDSPFIHSEYGSGVITLNYGKLRRILDFKNLTVKAFIVPD